MRSRNKTHAATRDIQTDVEGVGSDRVQPKQATLAVPLPAHTFTNITNQNQPTNQSGDNQSTMYFEISHIDT